MTTTITFVSGASITLNGLRGHPLRWSPETGFNVADWGNGGMIERAGYNNIYLGGRKTPVAGKDVNKPSIETIEFTPTLPGGERRG